MMKKILTLALFGLFVLAPLAAPPAARAAITSQKEIHIAPGETQDEIISFGGHVLIEGKVRNDVVVIGGSITISGEVGQSVVGIGSKIVVKSTASIGKDLAALGGTLEKEPGCTIGGDTIYFQTRELGDRLFRDGHLFRGAFSLSLIPIIVVVKLVFIFLWLIVAVLGAALFPKPIAYRRRGDPEALLAGPGDGDHRHSRLHDARLLRRHAELHPHRHSHRPGPRRRRIHRQGIRPAGHLLLPRRKRPARLPVRRTSP